MEHHLSCRKYTNSAPVISIHIVTVYDHLLGKAVNKDLWLFSSQRFGKHIFVTTKHLHGFPWIRAGPYKEPWRILKNSGKLKKGAFLMQASLVSVSVTA
jgi:hypothetical protein